MNKSQSRSKPKKPRKLMEIKQPPATGEPITSLSSASVTANSPTATNVSTTTTNIARNHVQPPRFLKQNQAERPPALGAATSEKHVFNRDRVSEINSKIEASMTHLPYLMGLISSMVGSHNFNSSSDGLSSHIMSEEQLAYFFPADKDFGCKIPRRFANFGRSKQSQLQMEALCFRIFVETTRAAQCVFVAPSAVRFYISPTAQRPVIDNGCCHLPAATVLIFNGLPVTENRGAMALDLLIRDLAMTKLIFHLVDLNLLSPNMTYLNTQFILQQKLLKSKYLAKARHHHQKIYKCKPEDIFYNYNSKTYSHGWCYKFNIYNLYEHVDAIPRFVNTKCSRCVFESSGAEIQKVIENAKNDRLEEAQLDNAYIMYLSAMLRQNSPFSLLPSVPTVQQAVASFDESILLDIDHSPLSPTARRLTIYQDESLGQRHNIDSDRLPDEPTPEFRAARVDIPPQVCPGPVPYHGHPMYPNNFAPAPPEQMQHVVQFIPPPVNNIQHMMPPSAAM